MVLSQSPQQPLARTVLVCQNRTCLKQGSGKVLAALQQKSPPSVEVVASQCLGQCGSGPMVQVLPDEVWYSRVSPEEVGAIVDRHLLQNQPVTAMLYPTFHPKLVKK
ncbi:MAG TPA: (2Fe-2S) ferredoxin domain-containing protein [Thermosynechococcaceae cyanobacterium]